VGVGSFTLVQEVLAAVEMAEKYKGKDKNPVLSRALALENCFNKARVCPTDCLSEWDKPRRLPQVMGAARLAKGAQKGAERAGFEPAVGFDPHAALAKRCFRPLSHLSSDRDAWQTYGHPRSIFQAGAHSKTAAAPVAFALDQAVADAEGPSRACRRACNNSSG
jgi:hypothetical protein